MVVSPGDAVVLMGRYSATRGGLVEADRRGRPLRVLKGDTREVQRQLRHGALVYASLALVALGATLLRAGWFTA